jgi:hypothetical protein
MLNVREAANKPACYRISINAKTMKFSVLVKIVSIGLVNQIDPQLLP